MGTKNKTIKQCYNKLNEDFLNGHIKKNPKNKEMQGYAIHFPCFFSFFFFLIRDPETLMNETVTQATVVIFRTSLDWHSSLILYLHSF